MVIGLKMRFFTKKKKKTLEHIEEEALVQMIDLIFLG
jgi:hypothetical protein